jgi:hypothetical protein
MHLYRPILFEDGQQLYTDGQQVYMMAAVTVDTAAPPDEEHAPQVMTPVVDPTDPLHQAFVGLSAAMDNSGSWPTSKMGAMASFREEVEEQDLWGVCWDFCRKARP